jgi:hypothetical protein
VAARSSLRSAPAGTPVVAPRRGSTQGDGDRCSGGQTSSARRASADSTPQPISCSVRAPGRGVVDERERAQVLLADGQHPAVVVAALALDGGGVAGQRRRLLGRHRGQLLEVDDDPRRRLVGRGGVPLGQQLADRDPVEVGQLAEPLHRHGAVAALVRADDDRLPAAPGLLLDAVQGQPLLGADGAQSRAQCLRVVAHEPCSRSLARTRSASLGRRSHHWLARGVSGTVAAPVTVTVFSPRSSPRLFRRPREVTRGRESSCWLRSVTVRPVTIRGQAEPAGRVNVSAGVTSNPHLRSTPGPPARPPDTRRPRAVGPARCTARPPSSPSREAGKEARLVGCPRTPGDR